MILSRAICVHTAVLTTAYTKTPYKMQSVEKI